MTNEKYIISQHDHSFFKKQIIQRFTSLLIPPAKKVFGYERSHMCTVPHTLSLAILPVRRNSFSCPNMSQTNGARRGMCEDCGRRSNFSFFGSFTDRCHGMLTLVIVLQYKCFCIMQCLLYCANCRQ